MGSEVNLGSFGITWVKRLFSPKCFNLCILHSITTKLIHVHWLETLCLFVGSKVNLWSFGVTWVNKIHFCLICYNSLIYDSLAIIGLRYKHQLGNLCLCYGVNGQPGVIWGHKCWFSQQKCL